MNIGIGNEAEQFTLLGIFVPNFRYSVFAVQEKKSDKALSIC
jgi:hypothetical protein